MMMQDNPEKICFVVANPAQLTPGSPAVCSLGRDGGIIGSTPRCNWLVERPDEGDEPYELRVFWHDGHFCLSALTDSGISVNGSRPDIASGSVFRLSDGDVIRLRNIAINAFIVHRRRDGSDTGEPSSLDWRIEQPSVEQLVDNTHKWRSGNPKGDDLEALLQHQGRNSDNLYWNLIDSEAESDTDPLEMIAQTSEYDVTDATNPLLLLEKRFQILARERGADNKEHEDTLGLYDVINLKPVDYGVDHLVNDPVVEKHNFSAPGVMDIVASQPAHGREAPRDHGNIDDRGNAGENGDTRSDRNHEDLIADILAAAQRNADDENTAPGPGRMPMTDRHGNGAGSKAASMEEPPYETDDALNAWLNREHE